jgi:hypothetical protein
MPLNEKLQPGTPDRAKLIGHLMFDHGDRWDEGFESYAVWLACQTTDYLHEDHIETHKDSAEIDETTPPATPEHLRLEDVAEVRD